MKNILELMFGTLGSMVILRLTVMQMEILKNS